jgi:hypothetical protein
MKSQMNVCISRKKLYVFILYIDYVYSGTTVHEHLSSRTNRFMNKSSEKKVSGDERYLE